MWHTPLERHVRPDRSILLTVAQVFQKTRIEQKETLRPGRQYVGSSERLELNEEYVETLWHCWSYTPEHICRSLTAKVKNPAVSEITCSCEVSCYCVSSGKTGMVCENCAFIDRDPAIPHHLWTVGAIDINPITLASCGSRPLRMETWKKWRRRSDWKSANAKDVRTKTRRAEMTGASRPRRGVVVHQLRNSTRTPPNSPSKWTPSSIQSSTTEMGREIYVNTSYFTELFWHFKVISFFVLFLHCQSVANFRSHFFCGCFPWAQLLFWVVGCLSTGEKQSMDTTTKYHEWWRFSLFFD